MDDVYNSVTGLTLFDVEGKRHGWALSRRAAGVAVDLGMVPLGVLGEGEDGVERRDFMRVPEDLSRKKKSSGGGEKGWDNADWSEDEVRYYVDDEVDIKQEKHTRLGARGYAQTTSTAATACFLPTEDICLRILAHLDDSSDLYAAARTNRNFYAAFCNNELVLMRRLVRAHRRLTLSVMVGMAGKDSKVRLSGSGGWNDDKDYDGKMPVVVPRRSVLASAGCKESLGEDRCSVTIGGWKGDEVEAMHAGHHLNPIADIDNTSDSTLEDDDATRSRSDSWIMTEEEAHRILWPDDSYDDGGGRGYPSVSSAQDLERAASEKVLVVEPSRQRQKKTRVLVEENFKSLVVMGDKSLREQLDQRIGIGVGGASE